jgi:uncharacterized protein YndB with AHSA1/START domain
MRKVEASIEINCPAQKVFDAFTEPSLLKGWWRVDRSLVEKKQGGIYALARDISDKGFRYISTGIITVYIPGKELLVDHFVYFNPEKEILGPTWLAIKIEEQDDLSLLQLIQGGYQHGEDWDWFYIAVKDAWPQALEALKEYLEGLEK